MGYLAAWSMAPLRQITASSPGPRGNEPPEPPIIHTAWITGRKSGRLPAASAQGLAELLLYGDRVPRHRPSSMYGSVSLLCRIIYWSDW